MANTPARAYYLTDRAYNNLVQMAQKGKYVPWGSDRVKGLSNFLNDLAVFPLNDTRPTLVKERHAEEIRHQMAPTWLNSRLRRGRLLKLTDDAIERYILAALKVGIINDEPFVRGGPNRRTPYPTVAFVLEAIGLGWLTPVETPNAIQSVSRV